MQNNASVVCPSSEVFHFALFHKSELELVYAIVKHSLCDCNLLFWSCLCERRQGWKIIFFSLSPSFLDPFYDEGPFIFERKCASGTKFS